MPINGDVDNDNDNIAPQHQDDMNASLFVKIALIFLFLALSVPLLQKNNGMFTRLFNTDGQSLVPLMPAQCPPEWWQTSASDDSSLSCFWATEDSPTSLIMDQQQQSSEQSQQRLSATGNNNPVKQLFYIYTNSTKQILPVWTVLGIRQSVLDAIYQQKKLSNTEKVHTHELFKNLA